MKTYVKEANFVCKIEKSLYFTDVCVDGIIDKVISSSDMFKPILTITESEICNNLRRLKDTNTMCVIKESPALIYFGIPLDKGGLEVDIHLTENGLCAWIEIWYLYDYKWDHVLFLIV